MVALSTLSQLGLMVSTLGAGLNQLAFLHLLSHAYFKAMLFIAVGNIIHCRNSFQDIRVVGNLAGAMPLRFSFFNLANLSLCGFPFITGFYSKDLILERVLLQPFAPLVTLIFFLATLLTAAYSARLRVLTSLRPSRTSSLLWSSDSDRVIVRGMQVLSPLSLARGPLLGLLLVPNFYSAFIPLFLKLLTLGVVGSGLALGLFFSPRGRGLLT